MLFFLSRCLACIALFVVLFGLLIYSTGDQSMGIMMLLPMIGLVPALVIALVLFVPIEALCARMNVRWLANFVVPAMGALGAVLALLAIAINHDSLDVMARNLSQNPNGFWFWIIAGVIWGVLWRMTTLVRLIPLVGRQVQAV